LTQRIETAQRIGGKLAGESDKVELFIEIIRHKVIKCRMGSTVARISEPLLIGFKEERTQRFFWMLHALYDSQ